MIRSAAPWGSARGCLDRMWDSLDKMAVANTPAVGGEAFFTLATSRSGRSSSTTRALASSSKSSAWSQPSTAVMSVDPQPKNDGDPFELTYPCWPLDGHHQLVYAVTAQLRQGDPQLFTPLITAEARAEALRKHRGQCLNCLGPHAFKTCPKEFISSTGLLNPDIADSALWRKWQRRVTSHRLYTKDQRDAAAPSASHRAGASKQSSRTSSRRGTRSHNKN